MLNVNTKRVQRWPGGCEETGTGEASVSSAGHEAETIMVSEVQMKLVGPQFLFNTTGKARSPEDRPGLISKLQWTGGNASVWFLYIPVVT